jgi:NADPH-dependent 2,4-dienoyl-CoA reductase/sulfur reductase-like enzyme/peroxiredoxin family protein/rhodanese-related sulfurtransferase/TusA-related sulfurtransferase
MKIIIIGGVAGGATAGSRLRRNMENAEIILFEKGEHISYANCGLPYYIGDEIKSREKILLQTPQSFKSRFNIDVRVMQEVILIDRNNKKVCVKKLDTNQEYWESYDKLVLAPGAIPFIPQIKGIESKKIFSVRDVADTDHLKNYLKTTNSNNPKHAVILGGGFIGLELAENLSNLGIVVTIIEMADQLITPLDIEMASFVHAHLKQKNIQFFLKQEVTSISEDKDRLKITLKNDLEIMTDMMIVSIGVRPLTKLAVDSGLVLGKTNGISVNEYMQTSDENIFACGDAVETWDPILKIKRIIPLAGPANKQARIIANNIAFGLTEKFNGSVATAIAKIFDINIASTGFNEKFLKQNNVKYKSTIIHSSSHASYYPGALPISIKLIFSEPDGKIFGAQAVGYDKVDKTIDIISFAIQNSMTINDLTQFEHTYAPPFSSAKSPVNMIAFVAENILTNKVKTISYLDVKNINDSTENIFLLDVRTAHEFSIGKIDGASNIPVDEIRKRLAEIPKDKKIYVYCAVGLRGYIACRILMQNGFDAYNVAGGYKTLESMNENQANERIVEEVKKSVSTEDDAPFYIDAKACQCPGPILKLNETLNKLNDGDIVTIEATDQGFFKDVKAWCNVTKNELINLESTKGVITAVIKKAEKNCDIQSSEKFEKCEKMDNKTIIVFDDSLDKALASFVIANGALSMGKKVTMFFTFWGLNVIKKKSTVKTKKDIFAKMFSMMLPKNSKQLELSKLNMFGIGPIMMRFIMKNKNIDSLELLIDQALKNGVTLLACQMSMDVMGIKKEELLDDAVIAGVATYLEETEKSNLNLFI